MLEAIMHHANVISEDKRFGRNAVDKYNEYGYVPCDVSRENVNLTLDFAYVDYCIAVIANALGEKEIYEEYSARARRYENLFDTETGFMRARLSSGEFKGDFDPVSWGGDYTEASAWQTTFSVPHDLCGLAELMGGEDKLLQKLDELFASEPTYRVGGYGREIHEMTEMATSDLGQCAISNQPSFLLPFIYACFGDTEKTRYWVERICNEYFSHGVDGFPGDEDNGTTAAWYIFAKLGIYPVCPADDRWITFDEAPKAKIVK
jgi:predicted alpha-1,2-mannosidase